MMKIEIDHKTTKLIKTWGITGLIFLFIAVINIGFIFSQPQQLTRLFDGEILAESFQPTGIRGGVLLAESWEKYPNYVIGLGVTALIAFSGAILCIYMIEKERRRDNDEENHNSDVN